MCQDGAVSSRSHPFRKAVEQRDLEGMAALLAEDIVFWSPVAFEPFRGRDTVSRLLEVLMNEAFQDFRYTDELSGADGVHALIFKARVGDRELEGLDLLRTGPSGLIEDFTVMIRPASGLQALGAAVGARYASIVGGHEG